MFFKKSSVFAQFKSKLLLKQQKKKKKDNKMVDLINCFCDI